MMMRKLITVLFTSLLWCTAASAQTIIGALPFTLQNGTIADANQVMSDFNAIVAAVNANAASAGVNNNITALNGLTTPLVYTSGGTSTYIGGTSSGSANAQVIASPIPNGFSLITGKSVVFQAGFTNSGPTQLNVASTGLINVFKQGSAGPVALSGGEIAVGNLVWAIYDGVQYQIGNVAPTSLVPACAVIDWAGAAAPAGYLPMNGATASRTTFSTLFGCITVQGVAATTTSGNPSVAVPNSALFQVGWSVGGSNVTCNSTIIAIPDGGHITLSANAGGNGATTLTIGPYPQGDCSTTFNVGDFRGRATAMRDTGGSVLTSAACTNPASIGTSCGAQTSTLVTGNLPPYTPAGTVSQVTGTAPMTAQAFNVAAGATGLMQSGGTTSLTLSSQTFTGTAQGGTSTPVNNMQPTALVDKYIKF